MKVIFMGSGEFGVPTLMALAKVVDVQMVFTQPDRPAGRHLNLTAPPAKEAALELNLPLSQPEMLKDDAVIKEIETLKPDAIVTASYGQIVPQAVLDIPRLGPINLHGSLLPKYRGAAPIHWAIINGERQTGLTTFFMEASLDSGPILLQRAIRIEPDDNVLTIESKLAHMGGLLMLETLDLLAEERLRAVQQDELLVSHAPKLIKEDARLDWTKSATSLDCLIRGTYPTPGPFTFVNGERIKVHKASVVDEVSEGTPGEVVAITPDSVYVQTGAGVLQLEEVQPASKIRMSATDFARGHHVEKGVCFRSEE